MSVLKYKIEKIDVANFELEISDKFEKLQLSTSFEFNVNIEGNLILCKSTYVYKAGEKILMNLELDCYFKVEEECFNSLIKDGVLTINQEMLQYMATIAVGTARGEIHARCQLAGSKLQNVVLPPINLTKIITSPSEYNL